jgi:hypothetical protein
MGWILAGLRHGWRETSMSNGSPQVDVTPARQSRHRAASDADVARALLLSRQSCHADDARGAAAAPRAAARQLTADG